MIYIHRISDMRIHRTTRENIDLVTKLCGDDRAPHVAIVTTMWDDVRMDVALSRERQLITDESLFKPCISQGARMFRHDGTAEAAVAVIAHLAEKPRTLLRIQEELVDRQTRLNGYVIRPNLVNDFLWRPVESMVQTARDCFQHQSARSSQLLQPEA